jgi:hypothetical protein
LLEPSREIVMGLEGGLRVWIMEDEVSEPSTNFCLVCFAGKIPSNILYRIFWVQEDERKARIVNPTEKSYGCSRD